MSTFQQDFIDYILSGHAIVVVETYEKDRAIEAIKKAAVEAQRNLVRWSIATGWNRLVDIGNENFQVPEQIFQPEIAIQNIVKMPDNTIFIMKDFGIYLDSQLCNQFDVIIAWLDTIKQLASNQGQSIVFVGPNFKIPDVLKHDIAKMEFGLPTPTDIEKHIQYICENVQKEDGSSVEIDTKMLDEVTRACQGMTQQEILDRAALALRKHKGFGDDAVKTLLDEKANVIKSSGLLTYIEPPEGGLGIVGGYDALKEHILLDKPCFSDEAREFGIEPPKGILMVGIPGCGKTLISTVIASEFGFPLIAMDVGSLMSKYVGDSEANVREAIKILESIAPCVLQIDEIEKGFGGVGDLDGGSSKRVFGTFLKWLNDHKSPVYVVATANQIESLPPELSRKGRFDEIFGLALPSPDERREIIEIHLKKRGRDPDPMDFDTGRLVKLTDDFTGSDIEESIKLGLKIAFQNKKQLRQSDLEIAVKSIVPLIKTEPQRVEKIKDWCTKRAKVASAPPEQNQNLTRKVVINS